MFGGVQIECLTMKETVMIKSKHSLNNSRTSKRKILFLLEAFDKGGIEKVTLDIVNHLDPNKYDITMVHRIIVRKCVMNMLRRMKESRSYIKRTADCPFD